jgi:hypothetical protein
MTRATVPGDSHKANLAEEAFVQIVDLCSGPI